MSRKSKQRRALLKQVVTLDTPTQQLLSTLAESGFTRLVVEEVTCSPYIAVKSKRLFAHCSDKPIVELVSILHVFNYRTFDYQYRPPIHSVTAFDIRLLEGEWDLTTYKPPKSQSWWTV
jgi:hypothetical protein